MLDSKELAVSVKSGLGGVKQASAKTRCHQGRSGAWEVGHQFDRGRGARGAGQYPREPLGKK